MEEVPYLGFLVGASGTRPQPSKLSAILDMTLIDMGIDPAAAARYSGMLGFYSKFIPDLHSTLASFHELKQKGANARRIMSSLRFQSAFTVTKHQLANVAALQRPNYTLPFYIDVDAASSVGAGAVLQQREGTDESLPLRPIAFWSRRFTTEERRYGVRDQECMGLVDALDNWRQYIAGGSQCFVRTDHQSLEWLLKTSHREGTRVQGFAFRAQGYDVKIEYVPGTQHLVGDFMSRSVVGDGRGVIDERPPIHDRVADALDAGDASASTGVTNALHASASTEGASQSCAVIVRARSDGTHEVLTECVDGVHTLPAVIVREERGSTRAQLGHSLRTTYVERSFVTKLINTAGRYRLRSAGVTAHYFVCPISQHASFTRNDGTDGVRFIPLADWATLGCPLHGSIAQQLQRRLERTDVFKSSRTTRYVLRALQEQRDVPSAQTFAASSLSVHDPITIPTIADCVDGPALISTGHDAEIAVHRIATRLKGTRTDQHPSVAIDLEGHQLGARGHTSLIQVGVDAYGEEQAPLVYVFDMQVAGNAIMPKLRHILEDATIVKVFHCCYGDVAAMFYEYGVFTRGIFDTGLADALIFSRHANKPRGLLTVLHQWLGEDHVVLHHKSTFVHSDHIWDRRPLPWSFFVYAYEDVTYCNALYRRLRSQLATDGVLELAFTLSQQRAPPSCLPPHHPRYDAPAFIAVALIDSHGQVICIQDDADCRLPSLAVDRRSVLTPSDAKSTAQRVWHTVMGKPPKEIRAAVNARMRKAIRVGDTLLYCSLIDDCVSALGSIDAIATTHGGFSGQLVVRQTFRTGCPSAGVVAAQRCLFQELYIQAARRELVTSGAERVFSVHTDDSHTDSGPRLRVSAATTVNSHGHVSLRLFTAIRTGDLLSVHDPAEAGEETEARVFNVNATSTTGTSANNSDKITRVAVILHNDTHVYTLVAKNGELTFPNHGIGDVDDAQTAEKAFDLYAGVSLRKMPNVNTTMGKTVMPRASQFVCRAAATSRRLQGAHGNTAYYSWHAISHDGLSLIDHRSAFYAAREEPQGFEMTVTRKKAMPGFKLSTIEDALANLTRFDRTALENAIATRHNDTAVCHCIATQLPHTIGDAPPQHSEAITTCPPCEDPDDTGHDSPQHSEQGTIDHAAQTLLPPPGEDPSFDALFTAAFAMQVAASLTAPTAQVCNISPPALTSELILADQLSHPGTSQYMEYLRLGALAGDKEYTPAFIEEAAHMYLDDRGLLMRRSTLAAGPSALEQTPACIVLPPKSQQSVIKLYHDFNAHLGVKKVLELIQRRFHWGSVSVMRKTISEHIRVCEPCRRAKIPHHGVGAGRVDSNGRYPGDIWTGDVYDIGIIFDGYSHTLDFVDALSRTVCSNAVKGTPTSEEIARIVLAVLIRHHGKPSEIRSDRGSNFISEGLETLYNKLRIRINASTAYSHHLAGVVERWHQVLKQMILSQRAMGADDDWPSRLPLLELAYNATVHAVTGYSPFFVTHARHAALPWELFTSDPSTATDPSLPDWVQGILIDHHVVYDAQLRTLRTQALHAKKQFDLKRDVVTQYQPGDRILLVRGEILDRKPFSKAQLPTDGPFTVRARLPNNRYVLTDLGCRRIHEVVNVSRMLPFPDRPSSSADWMIDDPDTGGKWPVHSLVGRRRALYKRRDTGVEPHPDDLEYKVHWLGFGDNYDKWVHLRYLDSIAQLVSVYNSQHDPIRPPLAVTPTVADDPDPIIPDSTLKVPHFRFVHAPPSATTVPPPSPSVSDTASTAPTTPSFPVTSRVEVWYDSGFDSHGGAWWPGVVTKTYDNGTPQAGILVKFDDLRYRRPFRITLAEQQVRRLGRLPALPPPSHATDPNDDKAQRRLLRLQRQLAI